MIPITIITIAALVYTLGSIEDVIPEPPMESISLEQALRNRGWLDE